MKINRIVYALTSLITLGEAKKFTFNVISIMGDTVSLGVKYDNNLVPLTTSSFPLFTGTVEADNISQYKYVALDQSGQQIGEESITRTYTSDDVREVYNRQTKKIEVPKLDEPFKRQFSMGSDKLQALPNNVIYNVYAKCDEDAYSDLSSFPFKDGSINQNIANCTFNIVSPDYQYSSSGNIHVLGYGSRTYKKLSWGVKFDKNFMGRKSIKMRAMASDPTLIREKLAIELYKSVGVPVQEGTYARLIINNDVYGLYLIIDSVSSKWFKSYVHGDSKAKLGVSYKLLSTHPTGPFADFKYLGDDYESYSGHGYKLDEFDEKEILDEPSQWNPLINFIKSFDNWVKTYDNDTSDKAVDELKKFFNIESFLRMLVVDTLIISLDNFFLYNSNAALYYNPQRNNYQIIPFDFDQALVGSKSSMDIDEETFMEDCFNWAMAKGNENFDHYFTKSILKHPQIKNRYDVILAKASAETYNKDKVHAFTHALADLIRDDVAWNFEAIDQLAIGYDQSNSDFAFENHFTLENFESNLDYEKLSYDGTNYDDATYGVQSFVETRGANCVAATANVDTSKNDNISDDYNDVKIPKQNSISGSITSYTTQFSLISIITLYLLYLFL